MTTTAESPILSMRGINKSFGPVHVLHEDRLNVVLANDNTIPSGAYIAQGSAASLNRVLKAQMASGQPANVHVHADGTVHAAH